jgi:hypothetical protein
MDDGKRSLGLFYPSDPLWIYRSLCVDCVFSEFEEILKKNIKTSQNPWTKYYTGLSVVL